MVALLAPQGPLPAPLPLGAMTGYAKRMLRAVRSSAMAPSLKDFCLLLLERSFGNAGFAARAGECEPGLWCAFDLAEWADALDVSRQSAYRARQRLISLGVVRYEPDPERPGSGRLGWQVDLAQWTPLDGDYRRARYARVGAGRKSNSLRSVACEDTSESNRLRSLASSESNRLHSVACEEIKQTTLASFEGAASAESSAPKKGTLRKKDPKEEERDLHSVPVSPAPLVAATAGDGAMGGGGVSGGKPDKPDKPDKVSKAPRQLSALDTYRVALLAAIEASNGGVKAPERAREWGGARRFYDWADGPAEIADVVACYEAQRAAPSWDASYLSLTYLAGTYAAWRSDPDAYRAAIARKRAAVEGRLLSGSTERSSERLGATHHDHRGTTGAAANTAAGAADDDAKWDDPKFAADVAAWNRSARRNAERYATFDADVAAIEAEQRAAIAAKVRANFERKQAERRAAQQAEQSPQQPDTRPAERPDTNW